MSSFWRYFLYEAHQVVAATPAIGSPWSDPDSPAKFIGEVFNVSDRSINIAIRQARGALFTVQRDNPLCSQLRRGRRVLLVIRDGHPDADPNAEPLFVGPLMSFQRGRETMTINAVDGWWRLVKSLLGITVADIYGPTGVPGGLTVTGTPFAGVTFGSAVSPIYKSAIIRRIVQYANEVYLPAYLDDDTDRPTRSPFCGVAPPPVPGGGNFAGETQGYAGPYVNTPASEAIQQISTALDAPEWVIDPVLPRLYDPTGADSGDVAANWFTGSQPPAPTILLGRMRLGLPIGGTLRKAASFELGYGARNISDFSHQGDSNGEINWAVFPAIDASDAAMTMSTGYVNTNADPSAGHQTFYANPERNFVLHTNQAIDDFLEPRLCDVVAGDGITNPVFRQTLLQEHLNIRSHIRETITFDPASLSARTPRYGTAADVAAGDADYALGDVVPFRAVEPGQDTIDIQTRVYGVNRTLSNDGQLLDAPVLVPTT
jgi:hypothetical protein